MDLIAAIPVKPFGVAKARLGSVMSAARRSGLGMAIAARTAQMAREAGAGVFIVSGDPGVTAWAAALDLGVITEDPQYGRELDGAAAAAVAFAADRGLPWAIVHADLPLVATSDLAVVFEAAHHGMVLAPSYDGGTAVVAGPDPSFPFAYGPGSFHRHLAAAPGAAVVARPGLALDLDAPRDLSLATRLGLDEEAPA